MTLQTVFFLAVLFLCLSTCMCVFVRVPYTMCIFVPRSDKEIVAEETQQAYSDSKDQMFQLMSWIWVQWY